MSDKTKEKKEPKVEVKETVFPQIATQLRGHYYVYTKDLGIFEWSFPYQSTHDDTIEYLTVIKDAVEKTIKEKNELEKSDEFIKSKEEKEIPIETK